MMHWTRYLIWNITNRCRHDSTHIRAITQSNVVCFIFRLSVSSSKWDFFFFYFCRNLCRKVFCYLLLLFIWLLGSSFPIVETSWNFSSKCYFSRQIDCRNTVIIHNKLTDRSVVQFAPTDSSHRVFFFLFVFNNKLGIFFWRKSLWKVLT